MKKNDAQIEFDKILGANKKNARVKLCIWEDSKSSDCSERIIEAHSIQRGKILSAIADLGEVYYLGLKPNKDLSKMETVFEKEGIKKFSTFKGFCGYHDNKIFLPIEDKPFTSLEKQMNIYAYRAASKELHANLESFQLCKNLLGDKLDDTYPLHFQLFLPSVLSGEMTVPPYIKEMMIEMEGLHQVRTRYNQVNLNVLELRKICDHIEKVLNDDLSPLFEHSYYSFDNEYPLACCTSFIPYFDFNGNQIISQKDVHNLANTSMENIEDCKNVFLNIFPEEGKTHIIFTYFHRNTGFKESITNLFKSEKNKIKEHLSSIILNYAENVAFKPEYIENKFNNKEKMLIKEIFTSSILDRGCFNKKIVSLFK